jgi:hypothetical protein
MNLLGELGRGHSSLFQRLHRTIVAQELAKAINNAMPRKSLTVWNCLENISLPNTKQEQGDVTWNKHTLPSKLAHEGCKPSILG